MPGWLVGGRAGGLVEAFICEENRLSWTEIHATYVSRAEAHIERALGGDRQMRSVVDHISSIVGRCGWPDLDAEATASLDFILTLSDFESFKDATLLEHALPSPPLRQTHAQCLQFFFPSKGRVAGKGNVSFRWCQPAQADSFEESHACSWPRTTPSRLQDCGPAPASAR